jgi:peptidoglycan-associated lipoprotein
MRIKLTLTLATLFLAVTTFAQTKYTTKAEEAFKSGYWNAAVENYQIAIKKEKDANLKMDLMYKMAQSYENLRDFANAVNWYEKVVSQGGSYLDKNPEIYLNLANSYKKLEDYESAIENYKKFNEVKPDDKRGLNGQKSCELALKWIDSPQRYKVDNMKDLNSKFDDGAPVYSGRKYDELIFSTYRQGAMGRGVNDVSGQAYPDLFYAKLSRTGEWSSPVAVQGEVNSDAAEGGAAFDSRKSTMYFTRCEAVDDGKKGCDIFYAKKQGQAFGEAILLSLFPDSLAQVVVHPHMSPDDEVLYFAANNIEGYGGFDLYYAVWNKKEKKFEDPVNLGPQINTAGDELYPYIHEDGTLYFSSNGHIGMGGFDLFKVTKKEDGYGPVENLKVPLNSAADDISIIFEGKEERGYLSSNRPGTKGRMDIWSFVLPPLEIFVQGVISNCKTKLPIENAIVTISGSDGSLMTDTTNAQGEYRFELKPNTTYQIASKSDEEVTNQFGTKKLKYFASEKALVDAIGVEESKTFVQDLCLDPIPVGGIELPNIVYEFNKATLTAESKIRLNGLVETMKQNPTLVIELGSHTDFRGSAEYNRKLAQARAQSAVDYLVSKGIARDRMVAKGYGEDAPKELDSSYVEKAYVGKDGKKPAASDYSTTTKYGKKVSASFEEQKKTFVPGMKLDEKTINGLSTEGLQECAHQMNRRTEFKVLRTDYKPGEKKEGEN